MKIKKIISGGQTGVDRAALDVALALNIPCGGWCPKWKIAEDGKIHPRYRLRATPSTNYRVRTEWNVRRSDGTLVITLGAATDETASTIEFAEKYKKPYLVVDLSMGESPRTFKDWVKNKKTKILNVAGPQESEAPGIYDRAVDFLWNVLYNPKVSQRTKKEPVVIRGLIKIREGQFAKGKQQVWLDTVRVKVIVPSSDWGKLWTYGWHNMDDFTKQFWSQIIFPAVGELGTKKGARGLHKGSQQFFALLKVYAPFLHSFFKYWVKRPMQEWPDYLKKLIIMSKQEGWVIFAPKGKGRTTQINKLMGKGTNAPYRLTKYCIEKTSKEEIKKYGLRLFSEPSYFLKTYIHKNGSATKIAKSFIEGRSREEVTNLAYQLPLRSFFEYLGII